jgi:hypothetical protein
MKHSNLYFGLVLPSGGWQSLIREKESAELKSLWFLVFSGEKVYFLFYKLLSWNDLSYILLITAIKSFIVHAPVQSILMQHKISLQRAALKSYTEQLKKALIKWL